MNIKRIYTALAAVAMATCNILASGFLDTARPASYIPQVDVHAGVGVSSVTQNYKNQVEGCTDFFLTPGCQTSFGVTVEMPIRNYLYVGTGIDFLISNYNWSMTILDAPAGTLSSVYSRNTYRSVDVPLYVALRFNCGPNVMWVNELGVFFNHGISGKSKYKSYNSSTNSLGQSQVFVQDYKRDYYCDEDPVINGVRRSDYGFHFATGLVFKQHWSLRAVLHTGLQNMAMNYGVLDIKLRNISASFKLGYRF